PGRQDWCYKNSNDNNSWESLSGSRTPPYPMTNRFFCTIRAVSCAALLVCVSGCQQSVVLVPQDEDLVVLNGCVISACNYLAVVKAQHTLDRNFWAKILLVRFEHHPAGHAYCVWETEGN